ncbi:MAG: hypothetical protein IT232_08320 [Flavobacteriales bacterium]|nr:hypothetical protein [Flavobacteriales bacterium]
MKRFTNLLILAAGLLIFGCQKEDPTPMPPVIKFMEAGLSQDGTYAIVKFEFFDNDGDLGLKQNENLGEQQYNLFVDYFEKQNGVWQKKSPVVTYNSGTNQYDTTFFHLRVPFIQNKEKKSLKGETYVKLLYNNFSVADTFKYEMILKDRALTSSNKIESSELFK